MGKIINLATKLNDGILQSPMMCMEDCLENDIGKRNAFKNGKKLLILCLDDTDGGYDISWCQAGMKASEMLALSQVFNKQIMEMMGY